MQYAVNQSQVGNQPLNLTFLPETTARHVTGTRVDAVDPYWGPGEFIYVKANGSIRMGGLCTLTPVWDATSKTYLTEAVEVANTANLGVSLGAACAPMADNEFGWLRVAGIGPVNCNASLAAAAVPGITAAGQAGANSAGKQILKSKVVAAATTTVAKANCIAANASRRLLCPETEGWFIGAYLSGTGIAAGTTVVSIDPDNRTVTLSADTTAQVAGTVTATYNNATVYYNIVHFNRPFAQGAIT